MKSSERGFHARTALWPLALVRALVGYMWARTAWFWLGVADRGESLRSQVAPLVESGRPADWYEPFLRSVVLPNADLFALAVTLGETVVAVSLLFGVATRFGAGLSMVLTANYALLYGQRFLVPAGNTLYFWVGFLFLVGGAGRVLGLDYWLHERWPRARIW